MVVLKTCVKDAAYTERSNGYIGIPVYIDT
jgi:hypothetical protein